VTQVFWIDHGYDRERAVTGASRYAEHVAAHVDAFAHTVGDISPVGFACVAWRLAARLEPGYVRSHRRVLAADCFRNEYDGGLNALVTLVAPWPAELTATRAWTHDQGWRDWPVVMGQYVQPPARDVARVPHLRATLLVEAPLPLDGLPAAPEGAEDVVDNAVRAVSVLVRELNTLLTPVVRQLEPA
jgi:hypothetical protein